MFLASLVRRLRRIDAGSWLLMAASVLICLAVLEVSLRWFAPLYPSPYQPDDRLLVKLVPGAQKVFVRAPRNGGQRLVWRVDPDGFRAARTPAPRGRNRVIVYGDSNVLAEFSAPDATFVAQLEQRLAPYDAEVINAGVTGYGPDQVSLRMPEDFARLHPSLVLVVVYAGNDFGDLLRNRIFGLDEHGGLELNHYRLPPALQAHMGNAVAPRGIRRLQLYRHTARLWNLLRGDSVATDARLAGYVGDSLEKNSAVYSRYLAERPELRTAENPFDDYYDADIALLPETPSARFKMALMDAVLMRVRDIAAQSATPLAMLILPAAIDACDGYDIQVDARRYPQYSRQRLSRTVESAADRAQIPSLNLFETLRKSDCNGLYFHAGDDHWNDSGQALAARLTAEFIERRQLPPACRTQPSSSRSSSTPAAGCAARPSR